MIKRNYFTSLLCIQTLCLLPCFSIGQTLEFEYLATDYSGVCNSETNCDENEVCFGLKYTPSMTGMITSYTFGFIGTCGGINFPFINGNSCIMNDNSSEIDQCVANNAFLLIASGNSGLLSISSGVPLILHKVCFDFNELSVINMDEDVITGLTVSIDSIENGFPKTDFPVYSSTQLNTEGCGCNNELLSGNGSINQDLNCFEEMDSIIYSINPMSNVSISNLPDGVDFEVNNNILSLFGKPEELGDFPISINLTLPCDTIFSANLTVQTPTSVMNKNHCYLDIATALDDVIIGDTIRIISSIITDQLEPVALPPNIYLQIQNNSIWQINN